MAIRKVRNIHFTNCRFERNGSDGLVIGPDFMTDASGAITDRFHFENISLTHCSFNNPGFNVFLATFATTDERPESGSVTNFRVIGCSFRQESHTQAVPSCDIQIGGSGYFLGCDFVSHSVPELHSAQIRFFGLLSDAIWRVIGNHFRASLKNGGAAIEILDEKPAGILGILNPKSKVTIVGNHFENDPANTGSKRPFVWLQNGDPSRHVIHSNIGDGQIYLEIQKTVQVDPFKLEKVSEFSWIDVSPGIPVTLGSPSTKGRNVPVELGRVSQVIEFGEELQPLLVPPFTPTQVDYQVNISFQWDAGNWWISKKGSKEFTIEWTNPAPANAQLDWTLHL